MLFDPPEPHGPGRRGGVAGRHLQPGAAGIDHHRSQPGVDGEPVADRQPGRGKDGPGQIGEDPLHQYRVGGLEGQCRFVEGEGLEHDVGARSPDLNQQGSLVAAQHHFGGGGRCR